MPSRLRTARPPSLPTMPARRRRDDAVHRRRQQRQLEAVVAELPGDVDVVGVARAPRGHDRDVVEAVGAAGLLPAADLDLHQGILGSRADEKTPRGGVRGRRLRGCGGGSPRRSDDSSGVGAGRAAHAAHDLSAGSSTRSVSISAEPLDLARIDEPGAEALGRLGAAGDAEAPGTRPARAGVAGGHEAGEEGVAAADGRHRLARLDPDAVERRLPVLRARTRCSRRAAS